MGLRSKDFERCGLSDSVKIKLSDTDKKRAKQIANYPWFENKKPWQKEIDIMLQNDFKLEVEGVDQFGYQLRYRTICSIAITGSRLPRLGVMALQTVFIPEAG